MSNFGIEHLYNPLALARQKSARSLLASSYDRRGGNHDWSSYARAEGNAAVLMETEGPGCITRIWTADPRQGTIRIFLDGSPEPVIESPLRDLFGLLPLSFGIGGEGKETYERAKRERLPMGHTSYCPIPFQRACKVTIEPEDDYLYYHINYDLYPPGTQVGTFDPATDFDTPEIRQASAVWVAWERGESLRSWADAEVHQRSVGVNETWDFLNEGDPGVLYGLRIALPLLPDAHAAAHVRDNLWLVAHFDDDQSRDPSVRAPIGPIFLDFGQRPAPRSLRAGTDAEDAYYTFFPMPYARSASLRLINRSPFPIENIRVSVLRETLSRLPSELLRFRAAWHIETPFGPDHRDYEGVARRLLNPEHRLLVLRSLRQSHPHRRGPLGEPPRYHALKSLMEP